MKVKINNKLGEECWTITLESGLEVVTFPKREYLQKGAYLLIDYGGSHLNFINSNGEKVQLPEGIAHFLEHKLFENQEVDVFEEMSLLGASVNAFTSQQATCYYFTTTDGFHQCLDLLLKIPMMKGYTQKGIEEEIPIISREIDMHLDDDSYFAYSKALEELYPVHPIGRDIAGTKESIRKITKKDLDLIMSEYYIPSKMTLVLVGDFTKEEIHEIVKGLPSFYKERKEGGETYYPQDDLSPKSSFLHKNSNTIASFTYVFKGEPVEDPREAFAKYMSYRILLESAFGESGEFFQKGYENQWFLTLSPQVSYGEGYFYFLLSGESTDPLALKKEMDSYLKVLFEKGIKEEDFQRIRNSLQGQFLVSFNHLRNIALQYIYLRKLGIHLFDYMEILDELTPQKPLWPLDKKVFSVVGRMEHEPGSI